MTYSNIERQDPVRQKFFIRGNYSSKMKGNKAISRQTNNERKICKQT